MKCDYTDATQSSLKQAATRLPMLLLGSPMLLLLHLMLLLLLLLLLLVLS